MSTRKIVEGFLQSEFAANNLFFHLQAGLPCPFLYKNGLGILLWFHSLQCTKDKIILSVPKFEVRLLYPTGRIIRFTEIDQTPFDPDGVVISGKNASAFGIAYERVYSACDEIFDFFESQKKVTSILLKKYYQTVEKNASDIGMEKWYGGLYDHNSSI